MTKPSPKQKVRKVKKRKKDVSLRGFSFVGDDLWLTIGRDITEIVIARSGTIHKITLPPISYLQ